MQIKIEAKGIENIQDVFNNLVNMGENTAPLMAELSNHLYNTSLYSFENEVSPDGIKWSPIQTRKNDPHPDKILYAQGTMQDSLSSDSGKDYAAVGLNAVADGYPYPIVHQFGTLDGKIEARAFMPIHEDGTIYENVLDQLEEISEDYLKSVLD